MRFLYFILLILINLELFSQEFLVSVDRNEVMIGEQITLSYTINDKAEGFQPPKFNGLSVLSGPNPSSYSNYSIINGKRKNTFTTSYSYYIRGNQVGKFKIEPARITVNGKVVSSKPIQITITKNTIKKTTQSQNKTNELFIKTSATKREIYQGEQILVTYKLYTRVDLAETEIQKLPSLNGFWKKDLETSSRYKQEIINGITYYVATIKKAVLTAQKSGELVIDPLQIKCKIRIQKQNNRRDPFSSFFNQYSFKEKLITSKSINIDVKELPPPSVSNFNGAVGNMKISASIDKTNIKANEALTYKVQLTGTGNIELIDKINVQFPTDFEVYDPKITEKIFEGGRKRSIKTFEYLLIPRYKGNYPIPSINFSFFNPKTVTYNNTKTQSFKLNIEKGEDNGENLTLSSSSQQNVDQINTDIKFIKTKLTVSGASRYMKLYIFYLSFFLPIIILIILSIVKRMQSQTDYSNIKWRNKKAKNIAQRRLKNAEIHMKNNETERFFEEIEKSIWGYFADKFSVQVVDLSKENVHKHFELNNMSIDIKNEFIALLDNCALLRYAPANNKSDEMSNTLEKAKQIIITIESKI